jgi:hypothetical protein
MDTPMDTDLAAFARLYLLVQWLADAETEAAEGAALQSQTDAARAARAAGDAQEARRQVERLTRTIATLRDTRGE